MQAATRKVRDAYTVSWLYENGFDEDGRAIIVEVFHVVTECDDNHKYVHEVSFPDDAEAAEKLAARVRSHGIINMKHWGFHEFFSLSLEERLNAEAYHEDLHRHGHGYLSNGVFSTGHA